MPDGSKQRWLPLAADFPPGLDTETEPTKLKDGYTPAAYNLNLELPGRLASTTSTPSGTTRIAKTFTISTVAYNWYFRRLWRANGANLEYYAKEYQASLLTQGLGKLSFDEDSQSIVTFFPISDNMFVGKSTGGYVVFNAASVSGEFEHSNVEQQMAVGAAGYATEMNGIAFASNASGIFAWNGGQVMEVTESVRTGSHLSDFASQSLTTLYAKRRIVAGTTGVFDVDSKRLFAYRSGDFLWTSRTLMAADYAPFTVNSIEFVYDTSSTTQQGSGYVVLQVGTESGWGETSDLIFFEQTEGRRAVVRYALEQPLSSRKFNLRLTRLDTTLRIYRINILSDITMEKETVGE
jgi:hypothetical protein